MDGCGDHFWLYYLSVQDLAAEIWTYALWMCASWMGAREVRGKHMSMGVLQQNVASHNAYVT